MPVKTMLRNLARRWADRTLVRSNDYLRRDLMKSQERCARQAQELWRATRRHEIASAELEDAKATVKEQREELDLKDEQIERQADVFEQMRDQADTADRRIRHLEETIVALGAGRVTTGRDLAESWWDDVAGVAGPEARQP